MLPYFVIPPHFSAKVLLQTKLGKCEFEILVIIFKTIGTQHGPMGYVVMGDVVFIKLQGMQFTKNSSWDCCYCLQEI